MIACLKPYPVMKDSGFHWLGKVPEHWNVGRLRTFVELRVSNVDKHSNDGELPVRLCNYVDVYKNQRITTHLQFMRATASPEEIERFRLNLGDVLITKDSEAWNDIGVPSYVDFTAPDLICGYHLGLLRPRSDQIRSSYLFRALQSQGVTTQFHVLANGVTRYGLSHHAIKSILLPVPPGDEQDAIVRFLDYVDHRIRNFIRAKQKLLKVIEDRSHAIIHQAVSGGLGSGKRCKQEGTEWLGSLPNHWAIKRLKYVFREVDQRSVDGTEVLLSLRMRRGLVPHTEVSKIPIGPTALIGFKKVCPGQLVINRMRAAIGMFGIAPQAGLVSPDYAVFEPIGAINSDYFLHLFKTRCAGAIFRIESKGLGTGSSGFMRLYTDRFGVIKVPVPPIEEQTAIVQAIANHTATINKEVEQIQHEIKLLRDYRARMIADVVTGKLDAREAVKALPEEIMDRPPDTEPYEATEVGEEGDTVEIDVGPEEAET